jgi:hypothetical protein
MAPAHETHSTWQRFTTWFRKQSRGRKVLLVVWAVVVLVLMVRAETLGTRFMVLGFSCLLLPVAWTLVPGKRR